MPFRITVKVTVPPEVLSASAVRDAIIRAQRTSTAPDLVGLFSRTVNGWHNPPHFSQTQKVTPNSISMSVYPTGPNAGQYALVNNGAKPHSISPTTVGGFLRFQPGYISSTRPRVIASSPYTRFGSYISTRHVNHPGFEAREFDTQIGEDYEQVFARDMQDAISSARP